MQLEFQQVSVQYLESAVELVVEGYRQEKGSIPFLPEVEDFRSQIERLVKRVFEAGKGLMAISDGELVGFLTGFEIDEFFGKPKGIYIPLFGHGIAKNQPKRVYQLLYEKAAHQWVQEGCLTHAITLYAHQKEAIDLWFWQGFGMRCVDALRQVEEIPVNSSCIQIKKMTLQDIAALGELHRKHNEFYGESPIFMPREDEDPIKDLTDWLKEENHHLWGAFDGDDAVAYMRIQPQGESFISSHKDIMNITGAYVSEGARGTNVGTMLLGKIQDWLKENDYPLCGVDFEAINWSGSGFWNKYFTPYTYSVVRRIDERVLDGSEL